MVDAPSGLRRRARAGAVAALSVGVCLLHVVVQVPGLGLTFLYLVPTMLAAIWLGPRAALLAGALGAGLFVLSALVVPQPQLPLGALLRLVTFCALGYGVARLFDGQVALRSTIGDRDRELAELRGIGEALTPADLPERPSLELASCFVPAEQVGGDFYIVAAGQGDATILVVGDVVGKGIHAARQASFVRTALTAFASFTDDPRRLLEMANQSLIEKSGVTESFVTAACVTYRPANRSIEVALAGHPVPLCLDHDEEFDVRPGMPLGVDIDLECEVGRARLPDGTALLLFTDGLTEARRPASTNGTPSEEGAAALFGGEHLERALARLQGADPATVVRGLHAAAEEFSGGTLADDLCLVAARAGSTQAVVTSSEPTSRTALPTGVKRTG